MYRACAARSQKYRLVQPEGVAENAKVVSPKFQLYDIEADPFEQHDLAGAKPDVVARMKAGYEAWFRDVESTRHFAPPRIHLGSDKENPVVLTRQDWRGPRAGWGAKSVGYWDVNIEHAGKYDVTITLPPGAKAGDVHFRLGTTEAQAPVADGQQKLTLPGQPLPRGDGRLEAWLVEGGASRGVPYVEVERKD
jgi:hypothetical protein